MVRLVDNIAQGVYSSLMEAAFRHDYSPIGKQKPPDEDRQH